MAFNRYFRFASALYNGWAENASTYSELTSGHRRDQKTEILEFKFIHNLPTSPTKPLNDAVFGANNQYLSNKP
eukprot:scaffold67773_cov20-Prasinocladus_malaysianus.AAC.2